MKYLPTPVHNLSQQCHLPHHKIPKPKWHLLIICTSSSNWAKSSCLWTRSEQYPLRTCNTSVVWLFGPRTRREKNSDSLLPTLYSFMKLAVSISQHGRKRLSATMVITDRQSVYRGSGLPITRALLPIRTAQLISRARNPNRGRHVYLKAAAYRWDKRLVDSGQNFRDK